MRRDSAAAMDRFQAKVAERGGRVLEPAWLGSKQPHRVLCEAGHEITPRPHDVIRGTWCIVCAGKDATTAWNSFRDLVADHGGRVIELVSLGANTPHRIICREGHETTATPAYVRGGGGVCNVCSSRSTKFAEHQFRALVEMLGGEVLDQSWGGIKHRVLVRCPQGHETMVLPNDVQQRGKICRICSGHDPATSWQAFRDRVAELGGRVDEPQWLGNKALHRVICALGHESAVRPNNVLNGSGFCRFCASKFWDAFYVVTNDTLHRVKFGIASCGSRRRLSRHRSSGYSTVVREISDMPTALDLERAVLMTLKLANAAPVQGREYFDASTLPIILDVVDHWPA